MIKTNDYITSAIKKFSLVILGVLGTSFLNRYLGPELRGSYAYMMNIVTMTASVLNLGLQQTFTIELRKNPENYENLKNTYMSMFTLQLIIYLLLTGVLYLVTGAHRETLFWFIIPFNIYLGQCNYLLISKHFTFRSIAFIINSIITTLLYILLFLFAFKSAELVVWINGGTYLIFTAFSVCKLKPEIHIRGIDPKYIFKLLGMSVFPLCISFLNSINYSIDIIFLEKSVPLYDVGLYSVAVGLANYVWLIPEIFSEVILSRSAKSDAIESVKQSLRFSTTIVIFVIIAIALFGKLAITILYGKEYLGSYAITMWLMYGVPVMSFFKIISPYVLSTGKTYVNFLVLLISAILNVVLNTLLIPVWGTLGAAVSSIFSYTICGFAMYIYFARTEKVKISDILLVNKSDITMVISVVKRLLKK